MCIRDSAVVALTTPVAVTLKPDGVLRQLGVKALGDLHHQGALHPLAEHLAAVLISAVDVAGSVQGVGRAAARTVQACPAVLAVGAGIDGAPPEILAQGGGCLLYTTEAADEPLGVDLWGRPIIQKKNSRSRRSDVAVSREHVAVTHACEIMSE